MGSKLYFTPNRGVPPDTVAEPGKYIKHPIAMKPEWCELRKEADIHALGGGA